MIADTATMKFLVSAANFKEEAPGTRGCRANPFLAAIDKVRDFGSSDDDRYGVSLSPIRWHSKDADMVSPSYRTDREVRHQRCCDELIREGQVDTA